MLFVEKRFNKPERSWIMYDWANSAHSTIIVAAIFPIYFASVAKAAGEKGDVWIAWALRPNAADGDSRADHGRHRRLQGMKKKLFSTSCWLDWHSLWSWLFRITGNG